MIRYIILFVFCFLSSKAFSNENLLTIQQQLERLQREVSDLSETVFKESPEQNIQQNNDLVSNFSAIDMRIYDLEKDVKKLNAGLEEILFQIEDIFIKMNDIENNLVSFEDKFKESIKIEKQETKQENNEISDVNDENTLGSLKITSEVEKIDKTPNDGKNEDDLQTAQLNLSPEDQFQIAFDNIRQKNWEEAKSLLKNFIENNISNQLSGSAYYWLGELYILEKEYREAALTFAEGYQKFPKSIKAPDMLFKLSQSLYEVNKIDEACKTVEKFIIDYPANKFIKNANSKLKDYGCLDNQEWN